MNTYIDSSVFLGMHSADDSIRTAAKNFLIDRFGSTLFMTLEDVGECDDVIWQYGREEQDRYYPFMDRLHTLMDIERVSYTVQAIERVQLYKNISTQQNLLLSMVSSSSAQLYTIDTKLLALDIDSVFSVPSATHEKQFPPELEKYYTESLVIRIAK